MKLLNRSITYVSVSILGIVTIWAVIFYINMLNEIKSSIDEGLENYKRLIIEHATQDKSLLEKQYFDESFFTITPISKEKALAFKDTYVDTILLMQDADDEAPEEEPVRMLTTAFEIDGGYYELKVANSMVEEDDLIDELFWDVIWLYIILIIGIVLINNVVLKKLWHPFYQMLQHLRNFRLDKTATIPQVSTKTQEFQELQTALQLMLQQSVRTFEQQKEFIGNASHELQTPLAIVLHKLELLIETESLSELQAAHISEIYETIQRLTRLNKSLLLLTKIENKQFVTPIQVPVNRLVKTSLQDFEDMIVFKNLDVMLKEQAEISVAMDENLAHILVSNLLRNAIFHNSEGGKLYITINPHSFTIANTGSDARLDEEHIFTRFYKGNPQLKHTGLGLAIVKAIADTYGYSIAYTYQDSLHCFTFRF